LKQVPEQQSLDWQQTLPFGSPQRPPQHCWPLGQLLAVHRHCPVAVQVSPGRQVPQTPPQPSGPHVLPAQLGEHTHCPWVLHALLPVQDTHNSPPTPQRGAWLGKQRPGFPGPSSQQPFGQLWEVQTQTPATHTSPSCWQFWSGELLDLAEEVRCSGVGRLLVRGDEELVLLTPVSSDRNARPRRPAGEQRDALLNIIGIGESAEPTDIAHDEQEYFAEAYAPTHR
jgi:hypothetical protein